MLLATPIRNMDLNKFNQARVYIKSRNRKQGQLGKVRSRPFKFLVRLRGGHEMNPRLLTRFLFPTRYSIYSQHLGGAFIQKFSRL